MNVRCPACHNEQPEPAAGATALCMGCGASILGPASTGAPAKIKLASPAPADRADDGFSARTMTMTRVNLDEQDALPSLSALVAAAHQEATATQKAAAAAVPPPPPPPLWHVRLGTGGELGPASHEELLAWQAQGRLDAGTVVWRAGFEKWLPLTQGLQQAGLPPPPPEPTQQAERELQDFLGPAGGAFASPTTGRRTVVQTSRRGRPRWQLAAAGVGAVLMLALASVGVLSLLRSSPPSVAVTSSVPSAPAASPAPSNVDGAPAAAAASDDQPPSAAPNEAISEGGGRRNKSRAAHSRPGRASRHRPAPAEER